MHPHFLSLASTLPGLLLAGWILLSPAGVVAIVATPTGCAVAVHVGEVVDVEPRQIGAAS